MEGDNKRSWPVGMLGFMVGAFTPRPPKMLLLLGRRSMYPDVRSSLVSAQQDIASLCPRVQIMGAVVLMCVICTSCDVCCNLRFSTVVTSRWYLILFRFSTQLNPLSESERCSLLLHMQRSLHLFLLYSGTCLSACCSLRSQLHNFTY